MKYINKFRKAFHLATVLLTLATLEALIYQLPVLSGAEDPIRSNADNPFCYMQTEGGLILNLESICEVKRLRPRETLSSSTGAPDRTVPPSSAASVDLVSPGFLN
jgi:hypothetical protein